MKLICYILLILLIPTIPVGAQTLSGGQVQVSNQSILISDNGQVMIEWISRCRLQWSFLPTVWQL